MRSVTNFNTGWQFAKPGAAPQPVPCPTPGTPGTAQTAATIISTPAAPIQRNLPPPPTQTAKKSGWNLRARP